MKNQKFGIIGNHRIAIKCLQYMTGYEGARINFVLFNPALQNPGNSIKDYCDKQRIPSFGMKKINTPECLALIRKSNPDIILSISNYWIMKKELLSIPKNGILNFHNGPPSNYRGIHIPSWVIMNGEKTHGVMWHFAEEGIDSGDMVGYEMFEVEQNETAATLMVKCINKGISLFVRIFPDIIANKFQRFSQNSGAAYYSLKDYPENGGVIDFRWSFNKIDRMVRGLNYLPFPNPYFYAKIKNNHGEVIVNKVSRAHDFPKSAKIGQVIAIEDDNFLITCGDSVVNIESSMDENMNNLSPVELAEKLRSKVGYLYTRR